MESGTDDARVARDPSTGPDNGIPDVPRVDRWDAGLGAVFEEGPRAVKSQNTRQSIRRDDTYVSCGSALTGAIRGNAEVVRQTHCYGESQHVKVAARRSSVSLGERALVNVANHDRFTACIPDRVPRFLLDAQQALPSMLVS